MNRGTLPVIAVILALTIPQANAAIGQEGKAKTTVLATTLIQVPAGTRELPLTSHQFYKLQQGTNWGMWLAPAAGTHMGVVASQEFWMEPQLSYFPIAHAATSDVGNGLSRTFQFADRYAWPSFAVVANHTLSAAEIAQLDVYNSSFMYAYIDASLQNFTYEYGHLPYQAGHEVVWCPNQTCYDYMVQFLGTVLSQVAAEYAAEFGYWYEAADGLRRLEANITAAMGPNEAREQATILLWAQKNLAMLEDVMLGAECQKMGIGSPDLYALKDQFRRDACAGAIESIPLLKTRLGYVQQVLHESEDRYVNNVQVRGTVSSLAWAIMAVLIALASIVLQVVTVLRAERSRRHERARSRLTELLNRGGS